MSRNVIIVLGMHRSYTSLIASWLHLNGVVMYDRKVPGLFEDLDVLSLHEDILTAHGMNWLNARGPFTDPSGDFLRRATEIRTRKSALHTYWGWKDPRTCILFGFLWSEVTAGARYIFIYRDPLAVVESLFVRELARRKASRRSRLIPQTLLQWYLQRHRAQYINPYLNCWNYYNQCCLHLARATPPEDRLIIKAGDVVRSEDLLRAQITGQWDIPLGDQRLADLMQDSTISQPGQEGLRPELLEESRIILEAWDTLRTHAGTVSATMQ